MPDLAAKPKIECDRDGKSDDEENNDDNDCGNEKPVPRQHQRPLTITHLRRVIRKLQIYDTELGNIGFNQAEANYFS